MSLPSRWIQSSCTTYCICQLKSITVCSCDVAEGRHLDSWLFCSIPVWNPVAADYFVHFWMNCHWLLITLCSFWLDSVGYRLFGWFSDSDTLAAEHNGFILWFHGTKTHLILSYVRLLIVQYITLHHKFYYVGLIVANFDFHQSLVHCTSITNFLC